MLLERNPNVFYGFGRRKRRSGRKRGRGLFESIGNVIRPIGKFIKDNKLISRGLALIPHPAAKAGALAAGALGFGLRRRRRVMRRRAPRRHGGSLQSVASSIHKFVKDNRIVSKGLRHFLGNSSTLGKAAHALGYGRRRVHKRKVHRRRVVRRKRGGDLKSVASAVHKFVKDNRLVSKGLRHFLGDKSTLGKAAHALGYGKRKVHRRRVVHRPRLVHHRRKVGGANFFSTEQIAVPKF